MEKISLTQKDGSEWKFLVAVFILLVLMGGVGLATSTGVEVAEKYAGCLTTMLGVSAFVCLVFGFPQD